MTPELWWIDIDDEDDFPLWARKRSKKPRRR